METIDQVLETRNVPTHLRPHVTDTMRSLARNYDDPLALRAEKRDDLVVLRNDAGDRSTTIKADVWEWVRYLGLTVPDVYKLAAGEKLPVADWAVYRATNGLGRVMCKKLPVPPEGHALEGEVRGTFDDAQALLERLSDEEFRGTPA